jgi:hypothetical protein
MLVGEKKPMPCGSSNMTLIMKSARSQIGIRLALTSFTASYLVD